MKQIKEDKLVVAVMREVRVGVRDTGRPCMWFSTYISENSAALQVLSWAEAEHLIKSAQVYELKDLEGKPCWVDVSDPGIIKFVRVWS